MKWGQSKFYFLKDFAKISFYIVIDNQVATNIHCWKHDQQSSNRLYALVFNLMTAELKNFLKFFENEGFTHIQGKNVSKIAKKLHTPVISLDEVGALSDETYGDFLCGFTWCSNEDFRVDFQHHVTQNWIDDFS